MQASCNDLRIYVAGKSTPRWIAAPNTSATKIWFNVNQEKGATVALLTAVGATGAVTYLQFEKDTDTRLKLARLPGHGYIYHGTEWFEYDHVLSQTWRLHVKGRGVFGTTKQAHSVGDSFKFIENRIVMVYGNSAVGDPATNNEHYDDLKPVFDLAQSTNDSFVYTATTGFGLRLYPERPGSWKPGVSRLGNEANIYRYSGNTGTTPAMGMLMAPWYKAGKLQAERATVAWRFYWAGGVDYVTATLRKYRLNSRWAALKAILLQHSDDGSEWVEIWSDPAPTLSATWESVSKASTSAADDPYIRFILTGTLPAAECENYFEVLTCTVDVVAANNPVGTLLAEVSNYMIDMQMDNETVGDGMMILHPARLNVGLDIDSEEFEVTSGDVTGFEDAREALTLDDESRAIFMRLAPGVNHLVMTGVNVGSLTANLRWVERRL